MEVIAIAKAYLRLKSYIHTNGKRLLVFFNNEFYCYSVNYWKRVETKEIQNEIVKFIEEDRIKVSEKFSFFQIENCVRALEALVTVQNFKQGSYIDKESPSNAHLIPVKNGILRVVSNFGELDVSLHPHTSDFIATYALPYDYDENVACPTWLNFLNGILSPDQILLLQEWFGYQLVPVTYAQKFMIFNGAGANGKSVVCLIMRLMLGNENVSSVPLQGFLSTDRFSLSATKDKLANIVPEIDELKTFPAGKIKSFSAGEPFSIEQKFKDSYLITPTARLTFATNTLPPFRDKTDGLMRRLLLLNFLVQILDESKQDKRLITEEFWLGLGELSGILNWALEGLRRLMMNSWQFTISQSIQKAVEDYNKELNPTEVFFDENIELSHRGEYHTATLYSKYSEYCRRLGFAPDNNITFGRAVGRRFKGLVKQSKHSKNEFGITARVWLGIRPKEHLPWDVTLDELEQLDTIAKFTHGTQIAQITQITQIKPDILFPEPVKAEPLVVDSKGESYESEDPF